MTTLKQLFEVYRPKAPDEQKFVDKHVTIKHKDRNGNGDDVFKGNTKTIKRKEERHGYDAGEDEKVYEEVEDLEELSKGTLRSYGGKALRQGLETISKGDETGGKRMKGANLASAKLYPSQYEKSPLKAKVNATEEAELEGEQIDELSRATVGRYSQKAKSIADNEGGKDRTKGRELAGRKRWGGTMKGVEKARVPATNEEVESLEEGTMKLSKVHIVHHHDHPAAKEFAKNYTDAMKGDHRDGGPTEKDEAASNRFHERYSRIRTREGFAGSGTHIYTDHKTGAQWKVDRHPNGKTFYGTDHIISHHTPNVNESLEEGEFLDTIAEDRVLRSLVAYYEELGEEVLLGDLIDIAEQMINELSKKTLGSYVKKASPSASAALATAVSSTNPESIKSASKRFSKRSIGIDKAVNKLTKEDVEQIDELSPATLGSYVSKAAKSATQNIAGAVASGVSGTPSEHGREMGRKAAKRLKGIDTAAKKLTKEDVINRTIAKYVPEDVELPSMEERLVAKLQDRISESHIETLLDLFSELTEQNQMAMLDTIETQEGINGLLDFALENRGE